MQGSPTGSRTPQPYHRFRPPPVTNPHKPVADDPESLIPADFTKPARTAGTASNQWGAQTLRMIHRPYHLVASNATFHVERPQGIVTDSNQPPVLDFG